MATAFGAIFTSTISETVTLNGAVRGNTNIVSIDNVNNVAEKIVSIPVGETPTIIGNFANAAKDLFSKLLHCSQKFSNKEEVINLTGSFVEVDPREFEYTSKITHPPFTELNGGYQDSVISNAKWMWETSFGTHLPNKLEFISGACCAVPKKLIHYRPVSFYQRLQQQLDNTVNRVHPPEGYVLEVLWLYIYGVLPYPSELI